MNGVQWWLLVVCRLVRAGDACGHIEQRNWGRVGGRKTETKKPEKQPNGFHTKKKKNNSQNQPKTLGKLKQLFYSVNTTGKTKQKHPGKRTSCTFITAKNHRKICHKKSKHKTIKL